MFIILGGYQVIITLIVFVDTFAWQKAINVVYGAMGSLSKWIDILYVF